jgi:hypothetical protein
MGIFAHPYVTTLTCKNLPRYDRGAVSFRGSPGVPVAAPAGFV